MGKERVKIKPCPNCGGFNVKFVYKTTHGHGDSGFHDGRLECQDCTCAIGRVSNYGQPDCEAEQEAIEAWNKEWL